MKQVRHLAYPATDEALVSTLALFGVDANSKRGATDEERKIAERFDVKTALAKAKKERGDSE